MENVIQPTSRSGFYGTTVRRYTNQVATSSTKTGGVYMLDLKQSVTNVSGASDPIAASFNSVVMPATSSLQDGRFVVALGVNNFGAMGSFIGGVGAEENFCEKVLVNGNSVNIAKNDRLVPVNGSDALVKAATTGTGSYIGIALGTATADGVLIPALIFSSPKPNV